MLKTYQTTSQPINTNLDRYLIKLNDFKLEVDLILFRIKLDLDLFLSH